MKTFFITTIAFLAISITCKAQWTLTGINIFPTTITNNVGIGTSSPAAKLHVLGGEIRLTGIGASGAASGGFLSIYDSDNITRRGYFGDASAGNTDIYLLADAGGALNFGSGGVASRMFISTAGNVGIGDNNPAYKLSVNSQDNTGWVSSLLHGEYYGTSISSEQTTAPFYVLDVRGGTTSSGGSGNSLFYVRADGNISIGTTDPQGYKLAVNGSAIATSMTVKPYASWPDYVFKPTYQLSSLTDVKTYIDKNHHLPDVPSAAEVEKNGLNLGEMNKVLVQKVEELTLYLIEKDKQLQEQQKTNQAVKQQLDYLTEQLKALKPSTVNNK
jgi:hypothetical protein